MTFLRKWLFRLILILIAPLALLAGSYNSTEVALTFLGYTSIELPISLWVVFAFLIGVGFGLLMNTIRNQQLKSGIRRAEKDAAKAVREIDALKTSSREVAET
ncbi:MAG: LapA family protein [Pseudomonadales bacterium]|nr:LapA family protein [Pseudomonadales bacterium]